jgi:hypothetical protein
MASLTNTKIKDTYDGLLKTTDNDALGGTYKLITDGLGNSSNLYLGTGGNVGIGESDPSGYWGQASNLVLNDSNTGLTIKSTTTGNGRVVFTDTKSSTSGLSDGGMIHYDHSGDSMRLHTNGSERMRIDSSGRVGIGTTSPTAKTDIRTSASSGATNAPTFRAFGYDTDSYFEVNNNANNSANIKLTRSDAATMFSIDGHSGTTFFEGNVGIGTTSPASKFVVKGSGTSPIVYFGNGVDNAPNRQLAFSGGSSGLVWDLDATGASSVGGQLTLSTNGSEAMRIDSSGNVGIGTSSPSRQLTVQNSGNAIVSIKSGTSSSSFLLMGDSSSDNIGMLKYDNSINSLQFYAGSNSTERMRIDSSGVVQVRNVDSPTLQLFNTDASLTANQVIGDIDFYQSDPSGSGVGVVSKIRSINSSSFQGEAGLAFHTGTTSGLTERMRITSGGDVLIGTTSNVVGGVGGHSLVIDAANQNLGIKTASGNQQAVRFANDTTAVGSINLTTTSTSYATSSDYRLKENVVDLTGALDRVDQLEPKRFNFIADAETTVDGFIAHEVQSVIPEAVTGEKDAVDDEGNPQYQGIDQSKIVPLLVGAIKELKAEIETLKSQINS